MKSNDIVTPDELLGFRERLGWSQTELAKALGVQSNTWALWERGALAVRHPTILRLALRCLLVLNGKR